MTGTSGLRSFYAQRQALAALRSHLRGDGRLVLDLFDPLLDLVAPSVAGTSG